MKPNEKVVTWKHKNALQRVLACKSMLYHHNFLTESEWLKVCNRIEKWIAASAQDETTKKASK
jgi:hypothetical protein